LKKPQLFVTIPRVDRARASLATPRSTRARAIDAKRLAASRDAANGARADDADARARRSSTRERFMTIGETRESTPRDAAVDASDAVDDGTNDGRDARANGATRDARTNDDGEGGAIAETRRARRAPAPRATTKKRGRGRPPKAKPVEDAGSLFWLVEVRF